jgi:hypothetical protein
MNDDGSLTTWEFILNLKPIKMKTKITGRDVKFFFLGVFIMFLIQIIYDWDACKEGFNKGYNQEQITDTVD